MQPWRKSFYVREPIKKKCGKFQFFFDGFPNTVLQIIEIFVIQCLGLNNLHWCWCDVAINIWFARNKFLQCLFSLPSSTIVLQLLISRKSQEKLERQILCHILWCPLSPPFWLLSTNLKMLLKWQIIYKEDLPPTTISSEIRRAANWTNKYIFLEREN